MSTAWLRELLSAGDDRLSTNRVLSLIAGITGCVVLIGALWKGSADLAQWGFLTVTAALGAKTVQKFPEMRK